MRKCCQKTGEMAAAAAAANRRRQRINSGNMAKSYKREKAAGVARVMQRKRRSASEGGEKKLWKNRASGSWRHGNNQYRRRKENIESLRLSTSAAKIGSRGGNGANQYQLSMAAIWRQRRRGEMAVG